MIVKSSPHEPQSQTDLPLRFYGRRRGRKLRIGQADVLQTLLPALRFAPAAASLIDLIAAFGQTYPQYWLDIGCGAGENMFAQAMQNPTIGFIGAEPFQNSVAVLLRRIEAVKLGNILIWPDDARLLLPALPDGALHRVTALFPDPWPKARHKKRRLIQPAMLADCARLLTMGGRLRLATDDADYLTEMLALLQNSPEFVWTATAPVDWRERPTDQVLTRYEAKARLANRNCYFFDFVRR